MCEGMSNIGCTLPFGSNLSKGLRSFSRPYRMAQYFSGLKSPIRSVLVHSPHLEMGVVLEVFNYLWIIYPYWL